MEKPKWVKDKTFAEDFETIVVPKYDPYKDFVMDNGCYVLIKVLLDTLEIAVAICDYKHVIQKEFRGTKSQDLYNYILKYDFEQDKKNNPMEFASPILTHKWFTRPEHCAYLGKELKKAEICLAMGLEYVQE